VSCKIISNEELLKIIPVKPPIVKRKINPKDHNIGVSNLITPPHIVAIQLNILIPVGIAIIIVALVK
jgi:hypothetical protein